MNQNVSTSRQQELVARLIELSRDRAGIRGELEERLAATLASCRHDFAAQKQSASRRLHLDHDAIESEHRRRLTSVRDDCESQLQLVKTEFEEKFEQAKGSNKAALSDGEYDWFLTKQRATKEYAADKQTALEQFAKGKQALGRRQTEFADLTVAAMASLARHRCQLVVQGGDLLEEPDDSDQLASHLNTVTQIKQLLLELHKSFAVRLIEEKWFLIIFLLAIAGLPLPLNLILHNPVATAAVAGIFAVLLTFAAWQVGRAVAAKTARQFLNPIAGAVTAGKQQLSAARQQLKRQAESKLRRLKQQHQQRVVDLDQQWEHTQREAAQRFDARKYELEAWSRCQTDAIAAKRDALRHAIDEQFGPRLAAIQQDMVRIRGELEQQQGEQLARLTQQHDQQLEQFERDWTENTTAILQEIGQMWEQTNQARCDFTAVDAHWEPPAEPVNAVRFGTLRVDLPDSPRADNDGDAGGDVVGQPATDEPLILPATLDLVHAPSLMLEFSGGQRDRATDVLRALMLRLLTSLPAGKLRFTIVDPTGLGQNFSAFMHLADHDEQLVGHRIWTESTHIQQRLTDLTQHMENVIQTYLRNQFASIHDYNQHAGEVAEPFHVLVVANFPAGFTDEAAQRLLSIVSSGPRCGVYTLISVDTQQSMPRNFALQDLRQATNVLSADQNELRWAEPPLSGFPIQLDAMPNEQNTSQLLHQIGQRAKVASRVEVPFAAVAPEAEWWTKDSRSEIEVALGRAGATKLQSMQLGRGTSQHVLISGKTGSGKSTLLHAMITNLALNYSPAELQFYLIDFKKGVEFKPYAEYQLPHARVIAIESEREFGMSVLQRLDVELRRRGDLFRRIGVQSLAGYRDARPDERMPRTLLIIDEFQEFFVKEDKIAQDAALLLDRLVRQGRAFGIHVLLGSQTLAGSYSLARATIGQMAVRIALQCSASDANLILSDDNDAARLLRRPGEAIYNDANGMVEGNHPFQVVWLSDVEKESYLRELHQRHAQTAATLDPPVVFEGNVAAQLARNELLGKAWAAPAPQEVPLAPRAWVGEAVAIKEPPAVVFHRRSGSNLMLVGQQEEAALGVMASCLVSLAAFSPTTISCQHTRFIVLDGTRAEASEEGYWNRLRKITGININVIKPAEATETIAELATEVKRRNQDGDDVAAATFLLIYNLARFRGLQKSDEDFGFGGFGEEKQTSSAEHLAMILREGPDHGVHTLLWSDTHTNLTRWLDRQSLRDIESRILFQMSATDSSNLMDSSAAAQLGQHRAILYAEDQGSADRFRPYGLPALDWLRQVGTWHEQRDNAARRGARDAK